MPTGNLIDGRAIAEEIHQETARRVAALKARGVQPRLVFVRVGEDPASRVYVGMKEKTSARLGISSRTHVLAANRHRSGSCSICSPLNADPTVHGILVQAPLPRHISETKIYSAVAPEKGCGWLSSRQRRQIVARRRTTVFALARRRAFTNC